MIIAILFYFCDSYLITFNFLQPAVYQGAVFDNQCLEIAKTNYLFLVVLFSRLNKSIVSCAH